MSSRFQHPYFLLILTSLFWSGNMVLGRAIRNEVPPLSLAFWRWTIALALTLPLALPHLRSQWPQIKRGWPAIVTLGLLGVGGYNTLAYIALQYTAATNAVLLNSFVPIATIALSWAFLIDPTLNALAAIAYTGIFPGFLGHIFYNRAVGEVGASKASLFIHLMPVFGILLAALFLGEVPQTYHFAGMTLIFAGIYLTTSQQAR